MKHTITAARILLGAVFLTFGLNYFLKFIPIPPSDGLAAQFMGALFLSKFLLIVKLLEIAGGALLLSKRFAPLGLTLLGPIIVSISLYDLLIAKAFNPAGTLVAVLGVFLLVAYRRNFVGLLQAPETRIPEKDKAPFLSPASTQITDN
ncbi:MAG: hypothetical protein AAGI48_07885 [Verrucomicrobiota bacterium]